MGQAGTEAGAGAAGRDGAKGAGQHALQVLVLDDSRFDRMRISRACDETGLPVDTRLTSNLEEFQDALDERAYDVVLIDYLLPQGDGLAAQRIVQGHARNFAAATVLISSEMRDDVAVASLKGGSLDCLDKAALDAGKLRDLMLTAARAFAEASRRWAGDLLAQNRALIAEDVRRVLREELSFGGLVDTIDHRVAEALGARGLDPPGPLHPFCLFPEDEPFRFK